MKNFFNVVCALIFVTVASIPAMAALLLGAVSVIVGDGWREGREFWDQGKQ